MNKDKPQKDLTNSDANGGGDGDGTKRKLILLVDDNTDVLAITKISLEMFGYRVIDCCSGQDAIELLATVQPDALIIDQGLPDVPGIEVGRQFKEMDSEDVSRLILFTGTDEQSLRDAAMKAGFDHFLVKPVRMNFLAQCIEGTEKP